MGERSIFVKTYVPDGWDQSHETVPLRVAREATVIARLGGVGGLRGRLGVPRLVDHVPALGTVATEAVSGTTLDKVLARNGEDCRRAVFLAGKWIQRLQSLRIELADYASYTEIDPDDLIMYCDIRLRALSERGLRWVTRRRTAAILNTVDSLLRASSATSRSRSWCHCDYSPGNIIWDGFKLTPIDFGNARIDLELLDVATFVHRLEMIALVRPWRFWPVRKWADAFVRGYGRPNVSSDPVFQAIAIRLLLCRLLTNVRRVAQNRRQAGHDFWMRACLKRRLIKAVRSVYGVSRQELPS